MRSSLHKTCRGKIICKGCVQSFCKSGNQGNCPSCQSERWNQITGYHTDEERIEELMNRIEKNDISALCEMSRIYYSGLRGVQQDRVKAMELLKKAAELGSSESHFSLGSLYNQGGDLKKAKFHYKAAALVGCEAARFHLGIMEGQSQNPERAVQHFKIAASAGEYNSMHVLLRAFNEGFVR